MASETLYNLWQEYENLSVRLQAKVVDAEELGKKFWQTLDRNIFPLKKGQVLARQYFFQFQDLGQLFEEDLRQLINLINSLRTIINPSEYENKKRQIKHFQNKYKKLIEAEKQFKLHLW